MSLCFYHADPNMGISVGLRAESGDRSQAGNTHSQRRKRVDLQAFWNWLSSLPWGDWGGKFISVLAGASVSWFLLFRKRLQALDQLQKGESDNVLFQAHFLHPVPDSDDYVLLFRNIAPTKTVKSLYDNLASQELMRRVANQTSLENPILQTAGSTGFRVLNDAFGHLAGHLSQAPFDREVWLFMMTCEDRQVVSRRCIRCFMIRPADLLRFADWTWCRERLHCERPWHWHRIVALHQIAVIYQQEQAGHEDRAQSAAEGKAPMIDDEFRHRRIREMSAGIYDRELPVGHPAPVQWEQWREELQRIGLALGEADDSE